MELIEQHSGTSNETQPQFDTFAYERAKEHVKKLKGFYVHLLVYIVICGYISGRVIWSDVESGATWAQAFQNNGAYTIWFVWGIGIAFHGFSVFVMNGIFGKNWEARKIEQYMNEAKNHSNKRF